MNYEKETIHWCIKNIFIITVQMPQSWSSLESHFQTERECLRGQVHGVSLVVAGCPSFHIAVFNHAVPSCRNLKLHGHKCRRAKLSVCSQLCALWQIMVQDQQNVLKGFLWYLWGCTRLNSRSSLRPGILHMWLCDQKWGPFQSAVRVSRSHHYIKDKPWFRIDTHPLYDGFILLNQQFWVQRDKVISMKHYERHFRRKGHYLIHKNSRVFISCDDIQIGSTSVSLY